MTAMKILDNAIHLLIKAVPGASKTECAGVQEGRLKVKIAAAPEDGKANAELVSFLAKKLGLPKRDVVLLNGEKSRLKTVAVPLSCKDKLEEIF